MSFVDNKGNKQWEELALDAATREVVGVYIGARDESAARCLWDSLPPVYRQCAVAYTDFWAAYAAVLPSKRHRAVGKETGKTSYTLTMEQHIQTTSVSVGTKNLIFFQIALRTTSMLFGILFTTTTHHYFCSTTEFVYSAKLNGIETN